MFHHVRRAGLGLASALALLVVVPGAVQAQKKVRGSRPAVSVQAQVVFSVQEREQIRSFFDGHRPDGLKPLPPGIRKNLARGKTLPPGIAKKTLPSDLLGRLGARPGYEVAHVGWDVVLVEVATGIVRDVLKDVIH
jgi:hypothetical protein